jgi:hypothetical protein
MLLKSHYNNNNNVSLTCHGQARSLTQRHIESCLWLHILTACPLHILLKVSKVDSHAVVASDIGGEVDGLVGLEELFKQMKN